MVQGTVKEAGCSGLRTPASWCRAQGRAQAASGAGLRHGHGHGHGHGRTDGRVHLAWHLPVAPAERFLQRRSLNPQAERPLQLPPAVTVIGAEQPRFGQSRLDFASLLTAPPSKWVPEQPAPGPMRALIGSAPPPWQT